MLRNIVKRILQTLIVLIGVAFLVFVMLRIIPGNAITTMMGEHAKLETIERMTAELGLDQPVHVQFWRYITGALRGDFGTSYSLNRSVSELIGLAFPNTLRLALVNWASVARIVRAETLKLKESEYVEAARSIGVGRFTIMLRHILPNCIPSLIVLFTLNIPSAILSESSLSFLGIGIKAPQASWGLMASTGRQFLYSQPWLSLSPSLAIMLIVLAFNFLGDGLRDVLDPHLKNQ